MMVKKFLKDEKYLVCLFTRLGIGFALIYAAVSSLLNPTAWAGFFPDFLINLFSQKILIVFSIYELALGVWLFSNWKTFYAAILSALTMAGIVIFNFGAMDIVFRDVAIFFSAVALSIMTRKSN